MSKATRLTTMMLMLSGSLALAQQSAIYTHPDAGFQKALELYRLKQYGAAERLFKEVRHQNEDPELRAEAAYYEANAAIRSNRMGADRMMEDFVIEHPTSLRRQSAFMEVGNYYFKQGQYSKALTWYDKVDDKGLAIKERNEFFFKKGYAYFAAKNYKQATKFLEVVRNDAEFGSQAKYYLGYMAYSADNYDEANRYFDQVSSNSGYQEQLSYYQAEMNFKLGNFDKAISLAKSQLGKADARERSELNKIIGESYFNLGQYEAALPFLQAYKGDRGNWSHTDYYQLGYVYYKQGRHEDAIAEFNKITSGQNEVAQNAYYHLGECYLKVGKKPEALNAFRNASGMGYNPAIAADAALNYARLSYEIGNPYEPVPQVLLSYLQKYPEGAKEEIRELLISSYLTSGNYEQALEIIERAGGYRNDEVYQKLAFYRALELIQQVKEQEATTYLERALSKNRSSVYGARSLYWLAEIAYRRGNYAEAARGFEAFSVHPEARNAAEYPQRNYQLGYAAFQQKQYVQAAQYFEQFLQENSIPSNLREDAYLRLADSQFVSKSYWPALDAYDKVMKQGGVQADYAAYQKALGYGLVDRIPAKIELLNNFGAQYPKSTMGDDALYELGNTLVNASRADEGIRAYDRLGQSYPMSSLVPKAILKKGLVYFNRGENAAALEQFRLLAAKYRNTEEAVTGVTTARQIYVEEGRVGEYAAWVKTLDFVDVSQAELDAATFEAAERAVVQQQDKQAISLLNAYLEQFPNGLSALKAKIYLARAYKRAGNLQQALPLYRQLASSRNEFAAEALMALSSDHLDKEQYDKAIPYLMELENQAEQTEVRNFAQSNLMRSYYQTKQYNKTLEYAGRVLEQDGIDARIKTDARIMVARSAVQTGNMALAREAYMKVEGESSGSSLAEALYYAGYFANQDGKYEASNAKIQLLVQNHPGERSWAGKGLLIMASNFEAMDDAFQATYILESVVERFGTYPEIKREAQERLQVLKAQQEKGVK